MVELARDAERLEAFVDEMMHFLLEPGKLEETMAGGGFSLEHREESDLYAALSQLPCGEAGAAMAPSSSQAAPELQGQARPRPTEQANAALTTTPGAGAQALFKPLKQTRPIKGLNNTLKL